MASPGPVLEVEELRKVFRVRGAARGEEIVAVDDDCATIAETQAEQNKPRRRKCLAKPKRVPKGLRVSEGRVRFMG